MVCLFKWSLLLVKGVTRAYSCAWAWALFELGLWAYDELCLDLILRVIYIMLRALLDELVGDLLSERARA